MNGRFVCVVFVRPGRIELPSVRWQRAVLPFNYGRMMQNMLH